MQPILTVGKQTRHDSLEIVLEGRVLGHRIQLNSDGVGTLHLDAHSLPTFQGIAPNQVDARIQFSISRTVKRTPLTIKLRSGGDSDPRWRVSIEGRINLKTWNRPYGVNDFIDELTDSTPIKFTDSSVERRARGFIITCPIDNAAEPVLEVLEGAHMRYSQLDQSINSRLLSGLETNGLHSTFSFPKEVRSACEQYLLYFGEFLRDLGVETSVELREIGDRILFSVTPIDKKHALSNIRDALEVFLRMPGSELLATGLDPNDQFGHTKLISAIKYLRAQLELSEERDRKLGFTVQAQAVSIVALSQLVAGGMRPTSTTQDTNDSEKVLGGLVVLSKAEKAGIAINVAEMYRRDRSWFKGKSDA